VTFAAITLCITSQVFIVVIIVHFIINSVQKILDTSSYVLHHIFNIFPIKLHLLISVTMDFLQQIKTNNTNSPLLFILCYITNFMEQNPPSFVEPRYLLPCLQELTTGPYPEPNESSPHPLSYFSKIHFIYV
jgi:hypothetical protein